MFQILIDESDSADDYFAHNILITSQNWFREKQKDGSLLFELGKILANPDLRPQSETFKKEMIATYKKSKK